MNENEKQILSNMGDNMRTIRRSKGLKLTHVAIASEMEKASLSRIETGKANPTVLTLLRVAKALDVPMKDFFKM